MARAVQTLAREYGVELLDIYSHIKSRDNWREAYRPDPLNPNICADLPVQYVDLINEHLAEAVR
jgi:hypothetical protein